MNTLMKSKIMFSSTIKSFNFGKFNFISKRFFADAKPADDSNVINLKNSEDFDTHIKGGIPIIVDFYADWCGPCRMFAPMLEKKAQGQTKFKLIKINVDNHQDLAEKYEVSGIPHIALFKNGKKVSDFSGASDANLNKMIDSI